jgi:TetR/AcrR family transcriptional regulator, transcriptional repressor for nem operon
MSRTKEFEPEEALGRALDLFWRQGYEATSVRELLDCMGIGRGSLYDTFGDKRALFLMALDRYAEDRLLRTIRTLEGSASAKDGIRRVFEDAVERLTSDAQRRGCLLANSAVELAPHDAGVAERTTRFLRRSEQAFHQTLVRARASGELPATQDPRSLARFLVNSLQGLRVLAKSGCDRGFLQDAARVTLAILDEEA